MRWLAFCALIGACDGGQNAPKDKRAGDDDDDNGDDDDNTGDDDDNTGDDDDNTPTDTGELTLEGGPYASLFISGIPIGNDATTYVSALFFSELPVSTTTAPVPSLDTCAFTATTTATVPTTQDPVPTVEAGEVRVAFDGVPVTSPTVAGWPAGQLVSFSAQGSADFPAFDLPALMTIPDSPLPATSSEVGGGVEVNWQTGGAPASFLSVSAYWSDGSYLFCTVEDDGSFVIPEDQLLGPGAYTLFVHRLAYEVEVTGGVNVLGYAFIGGTTE